MSGKPIPVVDLFAGPGGLGEGFSRVKDEGGIHVFKTVISIEKDPIAINTLRLRAFYRSWLRSGRNLPPEYLNVLSAEGIKLKASAFSKLQKLPEWAEAASEAQKMTLGKRQRGEICKEIRRRLAGADNWVLIGGPPCQAYSLVGRSRMQNHEGLKDDHRHFLYKEYLAIINKFEPTIFVMENVKGLNTAKVAGKPILPVILKDLRKAGSRGYKLHSLQANESGLRSLESDSYLIQAEKHGVPQARHRVIIIGVRNDLNVDPKPLQTSPPVTVKEAIDDLPPLEGLDSAVKRTTYSSEKQGLPMTHVKGLRVCLPEALSAFISPLSSQLADVLLNHEARSHMEEDLLRYKYWADQAMKTGKSPTLNDSIPKSLLPKHQNVHDDSPMVFADRFKVQLANKPSGTVTSHISKDGHYYIHYDPAQARSFSVREGARIQTFPDDYFFMGNRTQQYHQVGNAVPPYLAYQIGQTVAGALGLKVRG
jgi:DNA (cytosine-5)-methyltransferase 1